MVKARSGISSILYFSQILQRSHPPSPDGLTSRPSQWAANQCSVCVEIKLGKGIYKQMETDMDWAGAAWKICWVFVENVAPASAFLWSSRCVFARAASCLNFAHVIVFPPLSPACLWLRCKLVKGLSSEYCLILVWFFFFSPAGFHPANWAFWLILSPVKCPRKPDFCTSGIFKLFFIISVALLLKCSSELFPLTESWHP